MRVGKTKLIERCAYNRYHPQDVGSTIGVVYHTFFEANFTVDAFDPSGSERYRTLLYTYLKSQDTYIGVFDVSDAQGLEKLRPFLKLAKSINDKTPIILVGHKADMEPHLTQQAIDDFMKEQGITCYIAASAKTGVGIADFKEALAAQVKLKYPQTIPSNEAMIGGGSTQPVVAAMNPKLPADYDGSFLINYGSALFAGGIMSTVAGVVLLLAFSALSAGIGLAAFGMTTAVIGAATATYGLFNKRNGTYQVEDDGVTTNASREQSLEEPTTALNL